MHFINFLIWIILALVSFAGLGVFFKKNPVHTVLFLIFCFFGGSIMLLINNAEFLAFFILTVYVGAVAVLFLFVVMMIDLDHLESIKNTLPEKTLTLILGSLLFFCIFDSFNREIKINHHLTIQKTIQQSLQSTEKNDLSQNKINQIGHFMYDTEYNFALIIVALILMLAIIGVITLTIREKTGLKKQNSFNQIMRSRNETLEIKKVTFGQGVSDE